jgi:hypothetical protein
MAVLVNKSTKVICHRPNGLLRTTHSKRTLAI